jgi:UDP-N-acetylglucosamine diphosphorylase/glucosamine-1-phosphate N-acetyltransferase
MHSDLAKVLHHVCGKPMVYYSIDLARMIGSSLIVLVVGHQAEVISNTFRSDDLVYVHQREQLGTGHAVLQAKDVLKDFEGHVLILCGDVPLLSRHTAESLIASHRRSGAVVTVLTTVLDDPSGYGRVITDERGRIVKIAEHRDATEEERRIREINSGIYCVDCSFLFHAVSRIRNDNAQREYYLTDIIEIGRNENKPVMSFITHDAVEVMGINTFRELERADHLLRERRHVEVGSGSPS